MKLIPRFIVLTMLPTMLISLGVGLFSIFEQQRIVEKSAETKGELLVKFWSARLGPILANHTNGQQLLHQKILHFQEKESLISMQVSGREGEMLASQVFRTLPPSQKTLIKTQPIFLPSTHEQRNSDRIGTLEVSLDPRFLQEETNNPYQTLILFLSLGAILSLVLGLLSGKWFYTRIKTLSRASDRLAKGETINTLPANGQDEISRIAHSLGQIQKNLVQKEQTLLESQKVLEEQTEKLQQLGERLQDYLQKNQELYATKQALSNMVVHDLRTPLSGIASATELLRGSTNQEDKPFIEGISIRVKTLLGMIDDLLSVRKMEENKLVFRPQRFQMEELVEEVVTSLLPGARELGHSMEIECEAGHVVADRQLVARVLANFLGNALKYHHPPEPVLVKMFFVNSFCQVEVLDQGYGISQKYQANVFERIDEDETKDTSAQRRGTGLGLTFCRMVVEAHQGKIWVESQEGKGASFSFSLPIETRVKTKEEI